MSLALALTVSLAIVTVIHAYMTTIPSAPTVHVSSMPRPTGRAGRTLTVRL